MQPLATGQITISTLFDNVTASLDSDRHMVPTNVYGENGNFFGASTTISISNGITDETTEWKVTTQADAGIIGSQSGYTYTVTDMTIDAGTVVFTATREGYVTLTKVFSISKNRQGESAVAYSLELSATSIQKDIIDKVYIPESLEISGIKKVGDEGKTSQTGFFFVYEQTRDAITIDEYNTLLANAQTEVDKEYIISDGLYPHVLRYSSEFAESDIEYFIQGDPMALRIEFYEEIDRINLFDLETINVVSDGENAVVGYLTNESITLSATKEGTVSDYSSAVGTFKVNDGSKDVTLLSTFSVTNMNGCSVIINSTTGEYAVSAISSDYATAILTASYKDSTITKTIMLSKAKVGLTGDFAYTMEIFPSNGIMFIFDETNTSTGIDSTTLVAEITNITNPNYVWKKNDVVIADSTSNSIVVESDQLKTTISIKYSCTVTGLANGTDISITDVTTVNRSTDGAVSYNMNIKPSNGLSFTTGPDNLNSGIVNTTLKAEPINITTPTYIWKKDGVVIDGQTTNSLLVTYDSMVSSVSVLYSCTVSGHANGSPVTVIDTVTVTRTKDGTSGYNFSLIPTNGLVFTFNESNVSSGISSTVLNATPVGIISPSYLWYKNGSVTTNKTSSQTINSSDMLSINSVVYKCEVTGTVNGVSITASDTQSVIKTKDGSSAISILMSNENVTIPTDKNGSNGNYSSSSSTVYVYEGSSVLTYDAVGTSNSTWKIVATTATNITSGSFTDSGTFVTIGNASGITTESASILYTISGKRSNGTAFSITKLQSFSRVKTGADGLPAKIISLYGPNSFTYNEYGTLTSPNSILVSVSKSNISSTSYTWTYGLDGATPSTALTASEGQVVFATDNVTIYENATIWGNAKSLTLKAVIDGATNTFTIHKIKDANSGINIVLEAPNGNTFEGSIGDPKTLNVRLFRGADDVTSSAVIKWFFNGVHQPSLNNLKTITINPSDVQGSLSIRSVATYNSKDYNESIIIMDIADTYQVSMIGVDKIKNSQGSVVLSARVFKGSEEITEGYRLRWSNIGTQPPTILYEGSDSVSDRALTLTLYPSDISGNIDIMCEVSVDTLE